MMLKKLSHQSDDYRFLAPFYDRIAHLVFRGELLKAHHNIFIAAENELARAKYLVWIGGGTGYCLDKVLIKAPQAKLIYIEASWAMMKRAQTRLDPKFSDRVEWILASHTWLFEAQQAQRWHDEPIDAILTFFFLDVLPKADCVTLMRWAKHQKVKAWLFADFIPQQAWHRKLFISFMYQCFALTTKIPQRRLLNHHDLFLQNHWREQESSAKLSAGGLVKSCLFEAN